MQNKINCGFKKSLLTSLVLGAMLHSATQAQTTPIVPNIPNLPQQPNTPSPAGDALRSLPQFDNLKDKAVEPEFNNDFPVKINQGATGDTSKFPALLRLTKFESDLDQDLLGYNLVAQYFTQIINRSEWERISNEIWEGYRQNGRLVRVDLLFERDETIVSVTQLRNRKVEVFTDGVIDDKRQDLVLGLARQAMPEGAPVDLKALDVFLRKLEFQAKETVETEINSADGETVDFKFSVVKRRNLPDTKFTASFDNMGDNSFGKERTMLTFTSQVFSAGDQFSAQYLKSIGQDYLSLRYEAPAPDYLPLRMAAYINGLEYQVKDGLPKQFQHGYATIAGLEFSTPRFMWLDGQMLNTVGYEYKRSTDYVNDTLTYGKKIDSLHLKSVQTGYLSGRLNVLGDLTLGNLEYDHDGFLYPFDEKLIHAEYEFAKLNLEAQFEQPITRQSQLLLKARGQYASKNLDSLEKISISGINGVRAYNSDVGTGDEGIYAGVEFRKFFSVSDFLMQASVFYDIGQVRVAKNQYYSSINEGTFQGVGVGLTVRSGNIIFQTTYSESVGSSPLSPNDAKRLWSVATVAF